MTAFLHSSRGHLVGVLLAPEEYRGWVDDRRAERYRVDVTDEEAAMVAEMGRAHTRELLLAELDELPEAALATLLEIARAVRAAERPSGAPGKAFRDVIDALGPIPDDDADIMREAMRQCRQVKPDEW